MLFCFLRPILFVNISRHGFLRDQLALKAKQFVLEGDKYIVYALYKYDTNFDGLEAYLKYKMDDHDIAVRKSLQEQNRLKKQQAVEEFMAERRDVLSRAREIHADGIERNRLIRKGLVEDPLSASRAANIQKMSRDEDEEENASTKEYVPRWLLLYRAKFESYSSLLDTSTSDRDDSSSQLPSI